VGAVVTLFLGGIGLLVALVLIAALLGTLGVIFWALLLPFRLFGFVLKALSGLLLLPILIPLAIVAAVVLGLGFALALLPAIPVVLLALGVWWLVRRRRRASPA